MHGKREYIIKKGKEERGCERHSWLYLDDRNFSPASTAITSWKSHNDNIYAKCHSTKRYTVFIERTVFCSFRKREILVILILFLSLPAVVE